MSELKAFYLPRYAGQFTTHEVYIKYEADKVITEKDAVIAELKGNVKYLIFDNYLKEKELHHHKYKRCLAMAKWCAKNIDHLNSEGYIYEKEGHTEELADCIIKTEFYDKWYHRWLELAEKFKEVK